MQVKFVGTWLSPINSLYSGKYLFLATSPIALSPDLFPYGFYTMLIAHATFEKLHGKESGDNAVHDHNYKLIATTCVFIYTGWKIS